jgi:hypothetical protein
VATSNHPSTTPRLSTPFLQRSVSARAPIAEETTEYPAQQDRAPSPLLSVSPTTSTSSLVSAFLSSPTSTFFDNLSDVDATDLFTSEPPSRATTPRPAELLGQTPGTDTPPGFWDDIFADYLDEDLSRPDASASDSDQESYHTPSSSPLTPTDLPLEPEAITILPPSTTSSSVSSAGPSNVYVRSRDPARTHYGVRVRIYSTTTPPLPTLDPFTASSIRVFTDRTTGEITDVHIRRNAPPRL